MASAALTADAILRATASAALTVDAVLLKAASGSSTVDAVLRKAASGSSTVDAVLRRNAASSLTVDAFLSGRLWVDAIVRRTQAASLTVGAWIYAPRADAGGPGGPNETPLVSIMVDGVDITSDVVIADATFTMLVNGAVGTCHLRVRDDEHQHNFNPGSEITVDIDGKRRFGGYVFQPRRMFAFPVEDTTNPTRPSRFIVLTGVDYNILLVKRVVRDKANPKNVALRHWHADSRDDVIIKYVFDHYTDLAADGVTYLGVTHIGSPNPDKAGVVGSGGLRFVDLMREVNRLLSGVFYIDAYKDLNYVDVDTPSSNIVLTDIPLANSDRGYREFSQIESATGMVNDSLVWGLGLGATQVAFSRSSDAASIAAHGRWQFGEFTSSLYKQASVDRRAATIVYGTDQSKRGGKDDQESWTVSTFEQSFEVGQKVEVHSEVFGKQDVLPIRRLTMTFPTKRSVRFDLVLSHEIDEPWNMFEFFFPKIAFKWPQIDEGGEQKTRLPPRTRCDCSITDAFDRSLPEGYGPGWGVATCGIRWSGPTELPDDYGGMVVAGGAGIAYASGATGYGQRLAFDRQPSMDVLFWMQLGAAGSAATSFVALGLDDVQDTIVNIYVRASGGNTRFIEIYDGGISGYIQTANDVYGLEKTWVRIHVDSDTIQVKVWPDGDVEPGSWTIESTGPNPYFPATGVATRAFDWDTSNLDDFIRIGHLDVTGVTRCDQAQFDRLDRTLSATLGTSTSGFPWHDDGSFGTFSMSPAGHLFMDSDAKVVFYVLPGEGAIPAPWLGQMDMTAKFRFTDSYDNMDLQGDTQGFGFQVNDDEYLWLPATTRTGKYSVALYTNDGGTPLQRVLADDFVWQPDVDYYVRWQYQQGVYSRARIWEASAAQPETWLVSGTPITSNDFGTFGINAYLFSQLFPQTTVYWVDFDYAGKPCYLGQDCTVDTALLPRATVETITDPPLGETYAQGFPATVVTDETDPDEINGGDKSYVVWLKLVLTEAMDLVFDTYDSGMFDTILYIFGDPVTSGSASIYYNDDSGEPQTGYWSSINDDGSSNNLAAGTYWIAIAPYAGSGWNTNETDVLLRITRLAAPGNAPFPRGTLCRTVPVTPVPSTSGREDMTGDGSLTMYVLALPYVPGSTRVFVNGYFQRVGIDYTEYDPLVGTILFTAAPPSLADVSFFYEPVTP